MDPFCSKGFAEMRTPIGVLFSDHLCFLQGIFLHQIWKIQGKFLWNTKSV